jgi:parvulin-like peptidyl-prolyl isomerase
MSLIDVRIMEFLPDGVTEPTRGAYEAAKSEARAEALHLLQSIKLGTPFEQIARASSHGLHAAEGGDWGWIHRGMVRERFVPAVDELYRLHEGEVGGPVETPEGFFIVRCDKIDPGYDPDFEEAQPRLIDAYLQDHYGDMVTEHVAELRKKSGIDMRTLERFHMAVVMDAKTYRPEMGPS